MQKSRERYSAPPVRGANQSGMRAQNERLLLSLLHQRGSLAKRDITQLTGLSAQTVSVIMRQLEADGLLMRGEPVRGSVGQPSVPMSLNPDGAWSLGLKVGRRNAELVLIDFLGKVIAKRTRVFCLPQPNELSDFVEQSFSELEAAYGAEKISRIAGLGVALPFALWEWSEAIGSADEVMHVWRDVDLRQDLAEMFDFPVYLQNDGTSACGAELAFGHHRHLRDYVYFYIGSFVGGGIVINQCLYPGRSGNAGALGSMSMGTGRQLVNDASIITLERQLIKRGCNPQTLWVEGSDWADFEPDASAWIDTAARSLASAIAAASAVIDFEAAMIDGALPQRVRSILTAATVKEVTALKLPGLELPEVLEGSVGQGAKALGAASLPLYAKYLIDSNRALTNA